MNPEPSDLREIVERNANAVMTGNFAQLMADITPEALAKLMQMAPTGGPGLSSLPAITGYKVDYQGGDGEMVRYRALFTSETGAASFVTTWKQVLGQWKVVDFSDVNLTAAGAEPGP
jgi:hypothetical protein